MKAFMATSRVGELVSAPKDSEVRSHMGISRGGAPCLVVQRKELSGIPQPLFPGLRVAPGDDAIPPLAPFGQLDRVAFGPLGSRGGEDDLQQPPDVRPRQAGRGFFPPAAAPAGPGTTSPTSPGSYGGGSRASRGPRSRPGPPPACRARSSPR